MNQSPRPQGVTWLLRTEGAALLAAALLAYATLAGSWGWFLACFLLPDLALLAYLAGPRAGALFYNASHSTLGGLATAAIGLLLEEPIWGMAAAIWLGHVGFDRMLGYGLKQARGFHYTHLGPIGRPVEENK